MVNVVVATAFGGPEALTHHDEPLPPLAAGDVRVGIRAAGVNPIDVKRYSGIFGENPAELPMRLGSEAAGVVLALADDAAAADGPLAVGDEVIVYPVDGAYAQAVVVPGSSLVHKPGELSWDEASGLLLGGVTATHLLEATQVGAGDTVLAHGAAGGVGLLLVQLARLRGARVIATGSPASHAVLRDVGAEPVAYGPGLADRVRALAPNGVDVALDLVGTDEAVDVSLELVADRARIATIAAFGRAASAGITLLGGGPGADPGTELRLAARHELARLAAAGQVRVLVERSYPLVDAADAHRQILSGHTHGKLALLP